MAFLSTRHPMFYSFAWVAGMTLSGIIACQAGKVRTAVEESPAAVTTSSPSSPSSSGAGGNVISPVGAACGFENKGALMHIADGLDVCQPPTACTSETCPPPLGSCQGGQCVFKGAYKGLKTLPQAWATYYCTLSTGGCNGVTQVETPATTAQKLVTQLKVPLCEGAAANVTGCVGIAASSPMMVGNSQVAVDAQTKQLVRPYGLGLSEASNVCYKLKGPGGEAFVALTDRCGGYCKCNGSDYAECGACVNAADMTPNCPCVGSAPGVADACCGQGCAQVVAACDWCATNNHPHFDLDQATFDHLCGTEAVQGSCQITQVEPFACPLGVSWPPP